MLVYDWAILEPLIVDKFLSERTAVGVAPTLRRLHYLLVADPTAKAAGYVNTQRAYKALGNRTKKMREAGAMPEFTDRTRSLLKPNTVTSLSEALRRLREQIRFDRATDVPVMVVMEKDGLHGVVQPFWWLPRTSMRGYTSRTHVLNVASEIRTRNLEPIYLGDWDPSGLHMDHVDLPRRTRKDFHRVALTADHLPGLPGSVEPAKITDSRYQWMVRTFGTAQQVEVDALDPLVIRAELATKITELTGVEIDDDFMPVLPEIDARESAAEERLLELADLEEEAEAS